MNQNIGNFTVDNYRALVAAAAARYRFLRFGDPLGDGEVALWTHDIDMSPQYALEMAKIEAKLGVVTTYFVQVSSRFYSIFEPEVANILQQIASLGHDIGLHFDAEVCVHQSNPNYDRRINFEAMVLSEVAETQVKSFTLHNPTTLVGLSIGESHRAELMNGSCSKFRSKFNYCSDSNGIWRFRSLSEVIEDPMVTRLYALTHPEWWQLTPMTPRQRVQRCVEARAESCISRYDELLRKHGRPNIR